MVHFSENNAGQELAKNPGLIFLTQKYVLSWFCLRLFSDFRAM